MRFGEGCFDKFLHIAASHNGNAGTFPKASQETAPAQRRWINQQDADVQIRAIIRIVRICATTTHVECGHSHNEDLSLPKDKIRYFTTYRRLSTHTLFSHSGFEL